MTLVSKYEIEVAVGRLVEARKSNTGMLKQLGIQASNYHGATDSWEVNDEAANKIKMLCGPYHRAILKIMEIRAQDEV